MASQNMSADEKKIRERDAQWAEAANRGDLDAVMGFYASDATLVWPNEPAIHGTAAIRTALENMFKDLPTLKLGFDPERIVVAQSGDLASDFGKVTFTVEGKPDVEKYVVVWRKYAGEWKVLYDCYNSNAKA